MGIRKNLKRFLKKKILQILGFNELINKPPFLIHGTKYLTVGKNTYHNGSFKIKGANLKLEIGSYCAFGEKVTILKSNHNYNYASIQYSFYKEHFNKLPYENEENNSKPVVKIGNDVWIGDNVTILPGVTIGNGVCIGAGSIVTKSFQSYSIIAGVPAKIIKKRFSDEVINKLEDRKWWNYSSQEIINNKDFFFKNLNEEKN